VVFRAIQELSLTLLIFLRVPFAISAAWPALLLGGVRGLAARVGFAALFLVTMRNGIALLAVDAPV